MRLVTSPDNQKGKRERIEFLKSPSFHLSNEGVIVVAVIVVVVVVVVVIVVVIGLPREPSSSN